MGITPNSTLLQNLSQLQNITSGLSISVWWGLVETEPQEYDWSMYEDLFTVVQSSMSKPKVKILINFHACIAGTFSCDTNISLPPWLNTFSYENEGIFYTDVNGFSSNEYLTSGVDHINIFPPSNRTGTQMYTDFVASFAETFKDLFDTLIYEVQIGLGPNGELRYPAFEGPDWTLPGIGQFQCYDKYLQNQYFTFANKTRPNFAYLPPASAVHYDDTPGNAPFFAKPKINGSDSDYGQFFLSWYSSRLLQHGGVILSQMSSVLRTYSPNVTLAAKIGCIYWQNGDPSHAAEVTAGYMNYTIIAEMLQAYSVRMSFGCFDLSDREASKDLIDAHASPQQLVSEMLQTAKTVGLRMEATNSLPYATSDFDLVISNVKRNPLPLVGFTFNSLSTTLLDNLKEFRHFVDVLNATTSKH
eukprot:Phypoly_transcript_08477.p1 GENE.Phypoly_transcript_08477~~Phypoly_transcript_08477.p1  ORF type:complete len:484 (+),score=61.25 Phypoly_transcript_08477:208-1452(+)